MKLLSFQIGGETSFGLVQGDRAVDLKRRLGGRFADLLAVLQAGALEELAPFATGETDYALADITFLPVIPNPGKIICIGGTGSSVLMPDAPPASAPPLEPDAPEADASIGEHSAAH